MTAAAHVFPNAVKNIASKAESWASGSTELNVGLASGTFNWPGTSNSTAGYTTVSNFLTNSGSGGGGALTEVSTSSTGYSRQALSSVALSISALVTTLTCATITWTATANWSAQYAFFYDGAPSSTNDATTNQLVCYWDFGGTVSVVNGGNFTLTINASGLVTFTVS